MTDYLSLDSTQNLFKNLEAVGIELHWPDETTATDTIFSGKKFVITGSFQNFSRDEIKQMVTRGGGKMLSAISGNADVLICGEKAGSKLAKAQDLGLEIWEENKLPANNPTRKEAVTPLSLF